MGKAGLLAARGARASLSSRGRGNSLRLLGLVYLVIGVLVAAARDYFDNVDNVKGIVSALLAIVLWPLVVFDVDVDIDGGRDGNGKKGALPLVPALAYARAAARARLGRDRRASVRTGGRRGV